MIVAFTFLSRNTCLLLVQNGTGRLDFKVFLTCAEGNDFLSLSVLRFDIERKKIPAKADFLLYQFNYLFTLVFQGKNEKDK